MALKNFILNFGGNKTKVLYTLLGHKKEGATEDSIDFVKPYLRGVYLFIHNSSSLSNLS